ncbi:agmatine deiminase family protein [Aquisediminimonas sediminicola]|uniref:agmatine deiminase family protein n=1 Tax=Alteraquisediminimonas sediminicola TaxID=2676787 RepID=UPI001C8F181E|nr:agmatine deiminase family protein [Aquisediminimonas sediminicola]
MTLFQPPEWAPHQAVWIGFPSAADLWLEDLAPAQAEVAAFARAVHAKGAGERVILVAADGVAAAVARQMIGDAAEVIVEPFGDIWLRDTGPVIVHYEGDGLRALQHHFNGWGEKYDLPYDDSIGLRLAARQGLRNTDCDWIFEGGAVDVDGAGLLVTTEQCLLNPNRNPDLDQGDIELLLRLEFGIDRVLWLGEGLVNDHTDGHVDNLARFVAPNVLAVPVAHNGDDPNVAIYADARARAKSFGVEVVDIPSAGLHEQDGEIIPTSHMNFYIGNASVVVPTYGGTSDLEAVKSIARLFPGRRVAGLPANHILTGGGSFHCISQQIPLIPGV